VGSKPRRSPRAQLLPLIPPSNSALDGRKKVPKDAVFVLGVRSVEMDAVEALLIQSFTPYVYGAVPAENGGLRRVQPGEAYTAVITKTGDAESGSMVNIGANRCGNSALNVDGGVFSGEPEDQGSVLGYMWHLLRAWGHFKEQTAPHDLMMFSECAWNPKDFVQGRGSASKDDARRFFLQTKYEGLGAQELSFEQFKELVHVAEQALLSADKIDGYDDTANLTRLAPDMQFLDVASAMTGIAYAARRTSKSGALELYFEGFPYGHPVLGDFWSNPLRWSVYVTPYGNLSARLRVVPLTLGDLHTWEDLSRAVGPEWEQPSILRHSEFVKLKEGQELFVLTGEGASSEPEFVLAVARVLPGVPLAVATFKALTEAWIWLDSTGPLEQIRKRMLAKQGTLEWHIRHHDQKRGRGR
jgi:hypothetical protein